MRTNPSSPRLRRVKDEDEEERVIGNCLFIAATFHCLSRPEASGFTIHRSLKKINYLAQK